jgi:ubiquinone/menaquinone biosynthesis C-methylase UbiE
MTENQTSKPRHTYLMDPESPTEMARLMLQDRLVTEGMHGIFPERSSLENIQTILDVACGPGGWALDVAHTYPDKTVFGIDISTTMITYAQAQASAQRLSNASFMIMNALEPLNFAEGMFDLVNARAAMGFVPRAQWPTFLGHCFRVLRPGGILRLTEAEVVGLTNSPACEKMMSWTTKRLHAKKYGFSHDGSHIGILPMLGLLLQEAGCVNIQFKPHMLDFSTGTDLHESQYQNYMVWPMLAKKAFINEGIAAEEEFDQIYQQMLEDMQLPRFRGLNSMLTVWGEKHA